jgi:radical SAM protein with 4Fe4S-binding SPASM domain
MLNWFYDQSLETGIELKATCAPHYFRIVRQRRAAERRSAEAEVIRAFADTHTDSDATSVGATDMMVPGATGILLKVHETGNSAGHADGHRSDMKAMTKGCLAGTGVCFISHQGEVYPCGYLPVVAGDLRKQTFADVWNGSTVFQQLRATDNLKGKCGCCEFRKICMGCRARAFAATGDFLDEEPFCIYQPKMTGSKTKNTESTEVVC